MAGFTGLGGEQQHRTTYEFDVPASGAPRGRDGQVEAIRALMVAKRTARAQRTQTINQARALIS